VSQEDNCFEGKKRVAAMKRRAQDSSMNTQTEFAPMNVTAEQAWQKVLARDAAADGAFVYAVGSTGIYCRPSCPSKRPIRQVVSFYPSPAEARAAGFRACRRCRPDVMHPKASAVAMVCWYIDSNPDRYANLDELAKVAGRDPSSLQRSFKEVLGISPRDYQAAKRKERLRAGLAAKAPVTEAIYEAGFNSSSRAYAAAPKSLGMKPSTFRGGAKGETIRYTIADSLLGKMLVAATERGVCAIFFEDSASELERYLANQFPLASRTRDDGGLTDAVANVLDRLRENPVCRELKLDIRATAVQQRVWDALAEIPVGQTRTYSDVARSINAASSVRAVGRACAMNNVAVVIPCHRVVGAKGSLTGYRWGVERKEKLLELEKRAR
jgi:AraC family transcriptional regulator of adaptative response/methylated-DNA-[protein]-cysteine methyltransferase